MIFKKLFSRTVIAAFIVLIEVALIAAAANFFSAWLLWLRVIGFVSAGIISLFIIAKPQIPEIKLPWLIGLAALPVLATITYVFLGNAHFNRNHRRAISEIATATAKFSAATETEKANVRKTLGEHAGIYDYLSAQTIAAGYCDSKTDFLSDGKDFHKSLLTDLEKAEKFIFLEYFIIEEGQMWNSVLDILKEKVKRGVKVRVIYDDVGCAGKLKHTYYKSLRGAGINCKRFNVITTLRPSGVFNNRDHRKIAVIDGKIGYMGGINLADEYINAVQPLGYWKDSAIRIEGAAVKTLTSLFLVTFDYRPKQRIAEYSEYFDTDFPKFKDGGCIIPFGCGPLAPYDDQVGRNVFLYLIGKARKSVYITTPYLIVDHAITSALTAAACRGVDVRIITPSVPDKKIVFAMTRSSYPALLNAGVRIFEYGPGFMHAKQIITDEEIAFVGTMNLDYRSLAHHFECGAIIYGSPAVSDVKTDFDKILNVSEEKTVENSKQRTLTRMVLSVISMFRPLF